MSVRASSLGVLALLLGVLQACGSVQTADGGGDANADRPASGAAGTGGMANAGTTGGAGTGAGGSAVGGTSGTGGGAAGSGVAGTGVAGSGGGTAGAVGTAGTGGRGGAGGIAGRGGSGGAAGTGGRGGAGGVAGRGGAGGTAGAPGPECMTASDCKLVSDCCTCAAIPAGATAPTCSLVCIQSQCDARQLPQGAVACVAGRCVAGFACDTSTVTCKIATPTCPAGEVPSVNAAGTCYTGVCAPATQCATLSDCTACTGADQVCVTYQTQRGNQPHCVTLPPACGANFTCDCLGPTACVAPYRSCANLSGPRGITCSCPTC